MAPITTVSSKILFVDDEQSLLDGIKRQLRGKFDVEIALGGETALAMVKTQGPYAVVVSDMRMPGIDGAALLNHLKKLAPDTVRLMLTGNADQESAARAVNEGSVYRFLTKPCEQDDLRKALNDSLAEFRVRSAERELLQNTLSGSIKLLTDLLSIMAGGSFPDAIKLRQLVQKILPAAGVASAWDIELAAMLGNIGYVTVPSNVLTRIQAGVKLSPSEQELIDKVPQVGQSLLANIPRLEGVAKMVLYQNKCFDGSGFPSDAVSGEEIPFGSRLIKILKDLLELESSGLNRFQALEKMAARFGRYDTTLFERLREPLKKDAPPSVIKKGNYSAPNQAKRGNPVVCH